MTPNLEHEQYLLIFPQLQTNLFYMSPENHVQREIIVKLNTTRYKCIKWYEKKG